MNHGTLAQWLEQVTHNHLVAGSNPAGPTIFLPRFRVLSEFKHDVPVRPDHAPTMYGEDNSEPGYAALGRIMAVEYFKGILDTLEIEYK